MGKETIKLTRMKRFSLLMKATLGFGVTVGLLLPTIPLTASAAPQQTNTLTHTSSSVTTPSAASSAASTASSTTGTSSTTVSQHSADVSQQSAQEKSAGNSVNEQSEESENTDETNPSDSSHTTNPSETPSTPTNPDEPTTPTEPTETEPKEEDTPGWHELNGKRYWYLSNGRLARNKLFYSHADKAWFWAEHDGSIAVNSHVSIERNTRNRKYGTISVPTDAQGRLKTGEIYYRRAWYLLDAKSATLAHGMRYLPRGSKWVYYDITDGAMTHGERYINYDRAHTGWYLFDQFTGKMAHGMRYLKKGRKWVYYDKITGIMAHGSVFINGRPYYFDRVTGRRYSGAEERNLLVHTARSFYGKHPAVRPALVRAGGKNNPVGPCAAFVWYVFNKAGLSAFHAGGTKSAWPVDNWWWYRTRGRLSMIPPVGDFAFYYWPTDARQPLVSHEGIIVRVDGSGVWVADAIFGGIGEHRTYTAALRGYGHPYWN